MDKLDDVFAELDDRLLRVVNGKVPDLIKTELKQVLSDLGLALISSHGHISSEDVANVNRIIYSYLSGTSDSPEIDGYQILYHLQSNGWIIIPPQ